MGFFSWHSHIRQTDQPSFLSSLVTFRSRFTLDYILFRQNSVFVFGSRYHFGHLCQKHPSTNSVTFSILKVKSGLPGNGRCLLHPVILFSLNNLISRSSVVLFPLLRTACMFFLRASLTCKVSFGFFVKILT